MRKGIQVLNMRAADSYNGWKYHPADENGRIYLCPCGFGIYLRDKLSIDGFRTRKCSFKRNDQIHFEIHLEKHMSKLEG